MGRDFKVRPTVNGEDLALASEAGGGGADDPGNVLGGTTAVEWDVAVGPGASAAGSREDRASVAVGDQADASDWGAVVVGSRSSAPTMGVAIGYLANVSSNYGVAVGQGSSAGSAMVAVGRQAVASGTNASAFGASTSATGSRSTALGNKSEAGGSFAVAIGYEVVADHQSSVGLGVGAHTTADNQVMIGSRDLEITGITKGVVLVDRTLGTRHRVYLDDGALVLEAL